MQKCRLVLKNLIITLLILNACFGLSLLLNSVGTDEHITTVFVFAVFLVSICTNGYFYGVFASLISTLAVNFAFTFPFFEFNFTLPENIISAIIMVLISILTSTFITKARRHDAIKAESEKERMRANLLRSVSHDLRTPLTTIYGSSAALLENRDTLSESQKMKMLDGIRQDAEWLVRIVENLLSITKIDSGQVKIIKSPTVLEELIDAVIVKFKKRYPDQKIELDLPEDIVIIPIDAILIEQVIINILENAVQHAFGMTKLTLRVFKLDNKAIFEISDNGCGIRQERLKSIFNGFYESKDCPADSKKRNAGIGLSVCATIIKAHGGNITAENRRDGGAIFRFTLENAEDE